ncbi:MAG: glycosyltransferase family 9 protein [Chitinophagaceae bacterium]
MKILIIRFSSIGDIVLTTPVVRCLARQVAGADIHFLTKYEYRHIVAPNPYIKKVYLLKDNWEALIEELEGERYDYVIDLHKNLRTAKIKKALKKADCFSYQKLNWQKWLLTNLKINQLPPVHIVDRYLDTVKKLGVVNDNQGLDYFIPEKEVVKESDIPMSHQAGFIGLVIGASYATKKLPTQKLIALCTLIHHPIILMGGPEDRQTGDAIASVDPHKIYNASGKFTLNESADLVRRSKLVISHDTGLMHIAAAFKKPVISIWGNTVPAFGMTPYYGKYEIRSAIFEVEHLSCRPCSKLGYQKCPKGHFKCMNNISLEAVAATVETFLSK